jgi:hypothetical protein
MGFSSVFNFMKKPPSFQTNLQNEPPSDEGSYLFVFCYIGFHRYDFFNSSSPYTYAHGKITDIGFSNGWKYSFSEKPKRTHEFSSHIFCYDRFITIESGDCGRSLVRVTVREALARDEVLRGDLNYTGFEICVNLHENILQKFQEFLLSTETENASDRESPHFVIRIPARIFKFPQPRGCSNPWDISHNVVGKLRQIKRFDSDRFDITMMTQPLTRVPDNGCLQDRYADWLGSTLSFRKN